MFTDQPCALQRHLIRPMHPLLGQEYSRLKVSHQFICFGALLHDNSPPDPLNVQCRNESIIEMSHIVFEWKSAGIHLLGKETFRKIDQEVLGALNEQDKKIYILHMWLQKAQAKATYRVLVELFESMSNNAAANAVRKLAAQHSADCGKSCI